MNDTSMDIKIKRQRGKNFTDGEKDYLIDLVLPFKSVIENVKTDAVWNQKKNNAWSEITDLYNMQQTSGVRSVVQLKHLYDCLKRAARKEKSDDKVELYKTGGGTRMSTLSSSTQKVIGLLGDRMDALHNNVDSDAMYNDNLDMFIGDENIIIEELSDDPIFGEHTGCAVTSISKSLSAEKSSPMNNPTPASLSVANNQTTKNTSNSVSSSPLMIDKSKNNSKNIYDGLKILNDKRLEKSDYDTKFKNELYDLKIKKAKTDYETSQIEKTLMTQKLKFELEKLESEGRQCKIKEELLLLELKHKKKILGLD